jgi:cobalt-zinc-cadmium efflux system outer membrane protein
LPDAPIMQHQHSNHAARFPHPRRALLTCALLLLLAGGGCQQYQPQPLDMPGHHAAFLARLPDSPPVREFAARLQATEPESAAFDPSDGISSREAELLALVYNADLRLARLRAGVTQATAQHAGLWDDPTIGLDLTRIIQSTPEPWKVFTSVGITLPISGRLEIEKQRAGAEHAAELARVAQHEWAVRMSVRRAWSEWSALVTLVSVTREFIDRVQEILPVVETMERAGEMSRTEARLFRIEKATKLAELASLESRTREAQLRLHQLMGLSPDATLTLVASGIGPATGDSLPAAGTASAASLQSRSPAMLVAAAEYQTAEHALELEIRKQYPDLHLSPGYGREDGQDQVTLGLSVPIPMLNGNRQAIAQATARRELARATAEATMEHLLSGVRAAELRFEAAHKRREILEAEIVPLLDAQYADARQLARLGDVNTLVLLESLTRQQEAKLNLIEARKNESVAAVDLQELVGPPHTPPLPPTDAGATGPQPMTLPASDARRE